MHEKLGYSQSQVSDHFPRLLYCPTPCILLFHCENRADDDTNLPDSNVKKATQFLLALYVKLLIFKARSINLAT